MHESQRVLIDRWRRIANHAGLAFEVDGVPTWTRSLDALLESLDQPDDAIPSRDTLGFSSTQTLVELRPRRVRLLENVPRKNGLVLVTGIE